MSKKMTFIAITFVAAMPLAFAQAKPIKADEMLEGGKTGQITNEIRDVKRAELEEKQAERQELMVQRKDALAQKKCELAQKRISTKAGQLENNRKMYQQVYGNMGSRLTRLVERLDGAGLDTTNLKAKIMTLGTMTQKLYTDYDLFISEFKGTESAACDKTKEEFKIQFEGVRAQVALIKKDRAAIKDFFNNDIKTELQALKAQLEEEVEAEVTETTEIEEQKVEKDVKIRKRSSSSTSETETVTETSTQTTN